jgi:hypothetical protein
MNITINAIEIASILANKSTIDEFAAGMNYPCNQEECDQIEWAEHIKPFYFSEYDFYFKLLTNLQK